MNPIRVCDLRASALLLLAALCACVPAPLQAQFATLVHTTTRYAGNNTGTNIYSGDSGLASATSLNAPTYALFDTAGNFFLSDTANNCVRKIDTAGNMSTVAGLRVSGSPDTCNSSLGTPSAPAQGLLAPAGLAIDAAGTLYISDTGHNCVRTLASGAVDTFAANALGTAAGTCTTTDTSSVTPAPSGLALDSANNLYISIRDSGASTPVNQVLLHLSGANAANVCYLVGQPSAAVPNACSGITGAASLSAPAGLAIDRTGNLFIADTGNNCVRELASLTSLQTAAGQCANDGTGGAALLSSPYGLAVTPGNAVLITQSAALQNSLYSYSARTNTLTQIAGLPGGASGPYSTLQEGQSALSTPFNAPRGVVADSQGNIFLVDSGNNIVRELSTDLKFGSLALGSASTAQTVTFQINQASNLTASIGADYAITANTCTGAQTPAASNLPPATCQVTVTFAPTRPGARNSALRLQDSVSHTLVSVPLIGTGLGSLSLFTPGIASTLTSGLRSPIAVTVDSSGNTYVLEQGDAASTADVLFYPAGSASATAVVPQGSGIFTPTAMAVDAAGNIFIADASTYNISRFGADGSANTSYVTGLTNVSALAIDSSGNLYIAQAGNVHNVIEVYAAGGRVLLAGSGSTPDADGVPATSAQFLKPSGLALGPNGLSIADASGQLVYTIDNAGTIHITAGNGTSISTNTAQATGTAMLYPTGLAYDAAGDLYIVDQSASRVYQVAPVGSAGVNISTVFGNGASGYTGDGGLATAASLQAPLNIALDGSARLYVVDYGNSALRQATYSTVSNINFGDVVIGTSATRNQAVSNVGNASLAIVTPVSTTESHYTVSNTTTCSSSLAAGGACSIVYTFTPTGQGTVTAQSLINSNSFNSPLTVNLTASGLVPQDLPYSLPLESEVYGQPFTQAVNLNLVYPDLAPTGTMSFNIGSSGGSGGLTTCSASAPFSAPVLCNAPNSHLHVGTYNVNFAYSPDAGNISYHPASGTTTLTVTKAPLTVTPANVTKLYGAPITFPNPAASITGTVPGDLITAVDSTTATASTSVGTYQINTALITGGTTSLSDYDITYNVATLSIVNAVLNVKVDDKTRPYGAANPTFTSVTTGAQNGDTFTVTYATSATTTSPAGAYPITATVTGPSLGNYTLTVVAGTLTVTPIPLTVNVGNATRTYGAANPPFSSTILGAINGDTFTQDLTTTAAQFSDVGTYPINDTLGGSAAGNYVITVNPGRLTITPAPSLVSVTTANATRTYGAPNPAFSSTVLGTINGDTVTVNYTTVANVASPVGTYPIVPVISGTKASDYTFAIADGVLSVTRAPLSVAAASASRPYNTANPTFSGTTTGLLNGDTVVVTYSTTATLTSPVGTYPVTPNVSGAALNNYALTTINGTLTITPSIASPLTVSPNNATRVYGAANPTFSGTTTGLLNGDTVTVTYSSAATPASPVGAYPITATVSGAAASNYTLNVVVGTLTVTAAPLTVAANSTTRVYGAANPTFTGTTTGLLNGDTLAVTYSSTAAATSPVGSYAITPAVTGPAAANYALNIVPGTLTVAPAALNVTANNATRAYAAANPIFTGATTGLLNGDTVTISYSTNATVASPVGTYPIVPSVSGSAAANYSVVATAGVLTVTPAGANLTATAASATRSYGAANPVFTGTVTGLLNGDTVAVVYTSAATATSAPGTYPITAAVSGPAAANYTVNIVPGTLIVTQAPSSTTIATSASPVFYGNSVTFTATVSSASGTPTGTVTFLNGSTILGTGTLSASGTATYSTSSLQPGNTTITATYSGDSDFTGSTTSLTQVVSAGIFSLAATPASQFVRGAGSTVYTVTATSAQNFSGPVTLTCAGLPSDATCTFATPTLTLSSGGSATTTMTVTTTAADARLEAPALPTRKSRLGSEAAQFAPIAFAAVFPFELTGLGVLFAGTRRRQRKVSRSPRLRLLLLLLCTAGMMSLAGCACFTSVYKNYTVTINGTTTVPSVAAQSTSVILSVGQQ